MIKASRIRQAWDVLRGRVQAAGGFDLSQRDIQAGFRRLSGNDSNRDLAPLLQDKMIELAWYLYDRNPMAKRLINLTKIFVVGEGLKPQAEDEQVQVWLDGFWDDPVNRMDLEIPFYVGELGLFGEQLYHTTENPIDGSMRLWYIDPSEIDQVVYGGAPGNEPGSDRSIAIPIEVVLKQKFGEASAPRLQVYRPDEDPNSPSFGRPMGNCFYFAINKAKRSARGRSDIFAHADWLDAYEQLLFEGVDRAKLLNSFIWDVVLKGSNQEQIDEWLQTYGKRPRPGSIRAHNENVEWKAVNPELGSYEMSNFTRLFKNHILGTSGFPEHWFGEGGETNLATAGEMGMPTVKTLKERQKFVKHMLISICGVVVDRAVAHGSLPVSVNRAVTIRAPGLEVRDTTKLAAALQQITMALSLAMQEGWITKDSAAGVFANMVSQLGREVDAEKELEELAAGLGPEEEDYAKKGTSKKAQEPTAEAQSLQRVQ
jgi:hypothetical protein